MAQAAKVTRRADGAPAANAVAVAPAQATGAAPNASPAEQDKVLPLPSWLVKLYFIFPVVLYVPDVLFNYYVYSDGGKTADPNPVIQAGFLVLWSFLAVGVVGMAYLLSVLAPWHWGQGHRIQAMFCGFGVIVATAITTWNSLSYRSGNGFKTFPTDEWAFSIWPGLRTLGNGNVSVTMILVAVAPPFWGLFWAVVQPTETGRSLRQLQESHEERMLRLQQEAELKRLRAETNATVREAQLRGMAATAAAARQQATQFIGQRRDGAVEGDGAGTSEENASISDESASGDRAEGQQADETANPSKVLQLPTFTPSPARELAGSRGGAASFMNHAAAAPASGVHSANSASARGQMAQPSLLANADVLGSGGVPSSDTSGVGLRQPPMLGGRLDVTEVDGMTGTTGPRPAVRRANEPGSLLRGLNQPPAVQLVQEAYDEISASGVKRVTERELIARVAEKLNVDEVTARATIRQWRSAQRTTPRA